MKGEAKVAVIIPALNEELAITEVISAIPNWVDDLIVVDNGSTDSTAMVARSKGARVVFEPRRGYGSACLAFCRSGTQRATARSEPSRNPAMRPKALSSRLSPAKYFSCSFLRQCSYRTLSCSAGKSTRLFSFTPISVSLNIFIQVRKTLAQI